MFGCFHAAEPSTVHMDNTHEAPATNYVDSPFYSNGMDRPTFGLPPSRATSILSLIASVGLHTAYLSHGSTCDFFDLRRKVVWACLALFSEPIFSVSF